MTTDKLETDPVELKPACFCGDIKNDLRCLVHGLPKFQAGGEVKVSDELWFPESQPFYFNEYKSENKIKHLYHKIFRKRRAFSCEYCMVTLDLSKIGVVSPKFSFRTNVEDGWKDINE